MTKKTPGVKAPLVGFSRNVQYEKKQEGMLVECQTPAFQQYVLHSEQL